MSNSQVARTGWLAFGVALCFTIFVYSPGLSGGWLFDDYPNIVDNPGVQPQHANLASLVRAVLSSPASDFKRPIASLSFALNYLAAGLDPFWMKLTNLVIHLINGLLVFLLSRILLSQVKPYAESTRRDIAAALIAASWLLLPINLTAVLYVVQRMESMANVFVLIGLIGYVAGRLRMLQSATAIASSKSISSFSTTLPSSTSGAFICCLLSISLATTIGVFAKETAAMLPLYALLIEWALFGFRAADKKPDTRIITLFLVVLVLPLIIGSAFILPGQIKPAAWETRDFTLSTRLLSEARIVVDYIRWTLLPTPGALSFYHDNFLASAGLLSPWSTLASLIILVCLTGFAVWLRPRLPLAALGVGLFLGCQLLTATILPLELIYEHRNYFASFGLLLAVVPPLVIFAQVPGVTSDTKKPVLPLFCGILLGGLLLLWTGETTFTAVAWGDPMRLAENLASRAPDSPRAQYELGRTYIIYSGYDPNSPYTQLAYAPLARSAALPGSSILPEQALIFMNSRMHLPLKDAWWDSMIAKLKARPSGIQDDSSLAALVSCATDGSCQLPANRMTEAFQAALAHPSPSARLQATYSDYAWNVLGDKQLALQMIGGAVKATPNEPAYRITQIRMLAAQGHADEARDALTELRRLNIGGRLDGSLKELSTLPGMQPNAAGDITR
jgi:protein O-mannosyl-transferase